MLQAMWRNGPRSEPPGAKIAMLKPGAGLSSLLADRPIKPYKNKLSVSWSAFNSNLIFIYSQIIEHTRYSLKIGDKWQTFMLKIAHEQIWPTFVNINCLKTGNTSHIKGLISMWVKRTVGILLSTKMLSHHDNWVPI